MERDWQVTAILPGGIYIETDCNSGEQRRIEKVPPQKQSANGFWPVTASVAKEHASVNTKPEWVPVL